MSVFCSIIIIQRDMRILCNPVSTIFAMFSAKNTDYRTLTSKVRRIQSRKVADSMPSENALLFRILLT